MPEKDVRLINNVLWPPCLSDLARRSALNVFGRNGYPLPGRSLPYERPFVSFYFPSRAPTCPTRSVAPEQGPVDVWIQVAEYVSLSDAALAIIRSTKTGIAAVAASIEARCRSSPNSWYS
ncbi:uncharacterized protein METZ01_LOCUS439911, partial [marine metagenome]